MWIRRRCGDSNRGFGGASRDGGDTVPRRQASACARRGLGGTRVAALLVVASAAAAQATPSNGQPARESFPTVFEGVEVVRCLFSEQRVVVRSSRELIVLHPGDELPDADLRLSHADGTRLIFETITATVTPSGVRKPSAIVVLSRSEDGEVTTRVFRAQPPPGSDPSVRLRQGTATGMKRTSPVAEPTEAGTEPDPPDSD